MGGLTLKVVGAIETASLTGKVLGDASGLKDGEAFRGLEHGELPCERLGEQRVLWLLVALPRRFLLALLIPGWWSLASRRIEGRGHIDFLIFYIEDSGSDSDELRVQISTSGRV